MDFIEPSVTPINETDLQKKIERCYRICYKSESHMKEGSEAFLTNLIHSTHHNKHWSPLEHAQVSLKCPVAYYRILHTFKDIQPIAPVSLEKLAPYENGKLGEPYLQVTSNFRFFMEFIHCNPEYIVEDSFEVLSFHQVQKVQREIQYVLAEEFPVIFKDPIPEDKPSCFVSIEPCEPPYQTFHIVTTRDVLQELARHRWCSFSVESTRYCNYGKRGMAFTLPRPYEWASTVTAITHEESPEDYVRSNFVQGHVPVRDEAGQVCGQQTRIYDAFEAIDAMKDMKDLYLASTAFASALYNRAIALGVKPQEARMLLPGSLKTELMMTCDIAGWRHFCDLRNDQDAHPQIRILAEKIEEYLFGTQETQIKDN